MEHIEPGAHDNQIELVLSSIFGSDSLFSETINTIGFEHTATLGENLVEVVVLAYFKKVVNSGHAALSTAVR